MLALAVCLLAGATGCSGGGGGGAAPPDQPVRQAGPPLEPVRVLYSEASPWLLPYWLAQEHELFARNGLRVELTEERDAGLAYTRLLNGESDLYLAPLSAALIEQAAGGGDPVVLGGTPELAIVASRRFLAARELIAERFLRSMLEGIHAVQTQPEAARALLAQRLGSAAADQAEPLVRERLAQGERVPYLTRDDLAPLVSEPSANVDVDGLVDASILKRLEASGFVSALYRA